MLTSRERDVLLKLQRNRVGRVPDSKELALGNILVASGKITREQLDGALQSQIASGRQLGEELISAGHATRPQVEVGLLRQKKYIAYALVLATGLSLLPPMLPSAVAAGVGASIAVSVTVIANAKLNTIYQTNQIEISAADIAHGYANVSSALRFSVTTNKGAGYIMQFYPVGELFESVYVDGLGSSVHLGADGGAIFQRVPQTSSQVQDLSFRFILNENIKPGIYLWPLHLSVLPLQGAEMD
jgi:hypothetical protein